MPAKVSSESLNLTLTPTPSITRTLTSTASGMQTLTPTMTSSTTVTQLPAPNLTPTPTLSITRSLTSTASGMQTLTPTMTSSTTVTQPPAPVAVAVPAIVSDTSQDWQRIPAVVSEPVVLRIQIDPQQKVVMLGSDMIIEVEIHNYGELSDLNLLFTLSSHSGEVPTATDVSLVYDTSTQHNPKTLARQGVAILKHSTQQDSATDSDAVQVTTSVTTGNSVHFLTAAESQCTTATPMPGGDIQVSCQLMQALASGEYLVAPLRIGLLDTTPEDLELEVVLQHADGIVESRFPLFTFVGSPQMGFKYSDHQPYVCC